MPGAATSRTATFLVSLAVVAGVSLVASAAGSVRGPLVSAIAGVLLGLAVLARARDSPLGTGLASLLAPVVALSAVGGLGLSVLDTGVAALAAGNGTPPGALRSTLAGVGASSAAGFGAFGVVGTLRDGIGDGAVSRFWRSTLATSLVVVVALVVILLPRFGAVAALPVPAIDLVGALDLVLSPADPRIGLVTFLLLLAALAQTARLAIEELPLLELASRTRRDRVAAALKRADSLLNSVVVVGFLLGLAGGVLVASGSASRLLAAVPGLETVIVLLAAPAPRVFIATLILGIAGVTLVVGTARRLAGSATDALRSYLPSVAGGLLACALAIPVSSLVGPLLGQLPPSAREPARELVRVLSPFGTVLAVFGGALLVLVGGLALIAVAGAFRYVPSRAAGSAFAASGLVLGSIGIGVGRHAPLVVFAVVGLAVVAWDAGERGVVARAELGAYPPAHLEVVHAGASVAVAGLGIGLAWILYTNVLASIAVPGGSVVGTVAAVTASLVLIGVLRG